MGIVPLQDSSKRLVVVKLVFKLVELKTNLIVLKDIIVY
jgi:hypothetical protein